MQASKGLPRGAGCATEHVQTARARQRSDDARPARPQERYAWGQGGFGADQERAGGDEDGSAGASGGRARGRNCGLVVTAAADVAAIVANVVHHREFAR